MGEPSIRDVYARVCADSRYRLPAADAAHFTAKLFGISALEVWTSIGTEAMEKIASGLFKEPSHEA